LWQRNSGKRGAAVGGVCAPAKSGTCQSNNPKKNTPKLLWG